MNLNNYEIIILDCDGVVFDTNQKKIKLFKDCLSDYDQKSIAEFINYLKLNFGKTRKEIFNFFFKNIIQKDLSRIDEFLNKYSNQCIKMYQKEDYTQGFVEFRKNYSDKIFYLVSGSDQKELRKIFSSKNIFNLKNILGSPINKNKHFERIKANNPHKKILSIGDSLHDYEVSKENKIDFLFMKNFSLLADIKTFDFQTINCFEDIS
tara:strand:+ start:19625 stop:20245 length:621 start_codon:yes stop_codon:yes gene_type:complete